MRFLGGSLEWMDKLLCEGGEAVDSASLGDRRAVMLGCIGEFAFGADGSEVGEGPLLCRERSGAFLRIARGRGWEIGGSFAGKLTGLGAGGGGEFRQRRDKVFLWRYCIYKTILYL